MNKITDHNDLQTLHAKLGILEDYSKRNIPLQHEEKNLVAADINEKGREILLEPNAAANWKKIKAEAANHNIKLILVSGFRSISYQAEIIQGHLNKGKKIDDVLKFLAAPGYSEHHTGRALDITSPECYPLKLTEEFENTGAFKWLLQNSKNFNFTLSYPRDNPFGIIYEPWHWLYTGQ